MKGQSTGPVLSAIFVDYDNIYLSLKRRSDEAAKRFSKDAILWLKEIESGRLLTPTNGFGVDTPRRIVLNRCYGNPVPRRNTHDNSTDMSSFPFVRHHFLRAGFEVIDCPPLTAQLKNSSDIRMVMDVRDSLTHETRFDEFIILSGDADFTPVLHRLRAHARRTIIFANDSTATPYTAISDGEIREADLITLLVDGRLPGAADPLEGSEPTTLPRAGLIEQTRREIVSEVVTAVRGAGQPVPLEALADRAVRTLGHEKTVGSAWGGAGSFRDLLLRGLPEPIRVSEQPPYYVFDASRQLAPQPMRVEPQRSELQRPEPTRMGLPDQGIEPPPAAAPLRQQQPAPAAIRQALRPSGPAPAAAPELTASGAPPPTPAPQAPQQHAPAQGLQQPARARAAPTSQQHARAAEGATAIQQSIARIHEACQAPPLSPPEYRALFEVIAHEINTNGLLGSQTLINVMHRAQELGVDLRRDDARFVLDVVSQEDPWFEQGASANLFASRFRNFVVARCRSHGLNLSAEELDLIDAWFAGTAAAERRNSPAQIARAPAAPAPAPAPAAAMPAEAPATRPWWSTGDAPAPAAAQSIQQPADYSGDEFPRIVRSRR